MEWKSVEGDLPPHEKRVLIAVYHPTCTPEVLIGWYNHSKDFWRDDNGERIEDVLYWRTLPAAP